MDKKQLTHIGIYGIIINKQQILVIQKNRGPYKGKFDLPGGGMEYGEDLDTAIKREIKEEVGGDIQKIEPFINISYTAEWIENNTPTTTYHIGMYYLVTLQQPFAVKTDPDGHDSDGALWINISSIHEENTAPIAYKAISKYLEKNENHHQVI
jgi:8-oxo-dGTP diphosphatase